MSLYQSPFTTQLCFNKKRYISINNSNYKKSINNSNYKKSINNSNYKKYINNSNYKKSINNSNYKKIINYISFSLSILIVSTILTMPLSVTRSSCSRGCPPPPRRSLFVFHENVKEEWIVRGSAAGAPECRQEKVPPARVGDLTLRIACDGSTGADRPRQCVGGHHRAAGSLRWPGAAA